MSELGSAPVPEPGRDDHRRGAAQAPLVIAYADFECPFCAALHRRHLNAAFLIGHPRKYGLFRVDGLIQTQVPLVTGDGRGEVLHIVIRDGVDCSRVRKGEQVLEDVERKRRDACQRNQIIWERYAHGERIENRFGIGGQVATAQGQRRNTFHHHSLLGQPQAFVAREVLDVVRRVGPGAAEGPVKVLGSGPSGSAGGAHLRRDRRGDPVRHRRRGLG